MAVHRNARRGSQQPAFAEGPPLEELIERYGNQWIATARRSCPTAADAEDAYQHALEILLTSPPAETDPERIAAWMHTVIRNEGMQIIRARKREVDAEFEVIAGRFEADTADPEENVLEGETHGMSKEALKRLRPDQVRCLLLRADGFDYPEICRLTGFSYAKVNRLLSEGRKAARTRADAIVAGRECQRIEPMLSMFADGVADAAMQHDVATHLENCTHCRATLRDYKLAPRDLAALFPVGIAAASQSRGFAAEFVDRVQAAFNSVYERLFGHVASGSGSEVLTAKKIAAATAIAAAIAGGGSAIKSAVDDGGHPSAKPATRVAAGAQGLIDPIPARVSTLDDHRRALARRRARAATDVDVLASRGDGDTNTGARTATGIADDQVAADENDAVPQGAPADTGTGVEGLGP